MTHCVPLTLRKAIIPILLLLLLLVFFFLLVSMSEFVHLLKDKWFVSFLPLITKEELQQKFDGDWNRAAAFKTRRLDFVASVEELWSTMNSLPQIQQLPVGSTYLFSRQDKQTTYEAYPKGGRVILKLLTAPACTKGVDILLALILGESLSQSMREIDSSVDKAIDNSCTSVCDLVRLCGRQNREHPDLVQVEVWLNDRRYSDTVVQAIQQVFHEEEIQKNTYFITTAEFDSSSTNKNRQ